VIGDNVWIGDNVFIREGITIGQGSIIGANSVVVKDIPENAIVVATLPGPSSKAVPPGHHLIKDDRPNLGRFKLFRL